MDKQWYAIYTKAHMEMFARKQLAEKDITSFCPMIKDHRLNKGNLIGKLKPLFPGYTFARFALDTDYHRVKWTPGVKKVIGYGDHPVPLKGEIIAFIKSLINEDGIIGGKELHRGDRVRIKDGPFRGFVGMLEENASPAGRIKVLMEFVKYSTRLEIPAILVESVG